jgi:hypothetical protein
LESAVEAPGHTLCGTPVLFQPQPRLLTTVKPVDNRPTLRNKAKTPKNITGK